MTEPLISIIMPVYNAAEYLKCAVDSVLHQTYNDLEVILVDDGSTDGSAGICDSFGDPRIRVIHNEVSLGAAGARNRGLDAARGEFIAFVDADDYVHPKYIEVLYRTLTEAGADIACCGFRRTFGGAGYGDVTGGERVTVMSGADAALNMVDRRSMFYVVFWNKLYRRSIWDGLRLPEGKRAEDFYISYRFLSRAKTVAITDACLYFYVQQRGSVMHVHDDFSIYMEEALDGFDRFLEERVEDAAKRSRYKELSLIFRADTVVEDYWKAYRLHDRARMDETCARMMVLKEQMLAAGVPRRLKFRLFYMSRPLYRIGRWAFDVMESVRIRIGRDSEGRIG